MLKKIIVLWLITTSFPGAGPAPKPDPYTGQYLISINAIAHLDTKTEVRHKEFDTASAAALFIKNAPAHIQKKMKTVVLEEIQDGLIIGR